MNIKKPRGKFSLTSALGSFDKKLVQLYFYIKKNECQLMQFISRQIVHVVKLESQVICFRQKCVTFTHKEALDKGEKGIF